MLSQQSVTKSPHMQMRLLLCVNSQMGTTVGQVERNREKETVQIRELLPHPCSCHEGSEQMLQEGARVGTRLLPIFSQKDWTGFALQTTQVP